MQVAQGSREYRPGVFTSSVKDASPSDGQITSWDSISWTADTPTSTDLQMQVAASSSPSGPFNFVGPDGTPATFFSSGDSLSQFDGSRYLQYQAVLTTTNSSFTPDLQDVSVCFTDACPE